MPLHEYNLWVYTEPENLVPSELKAMFALSMPKMDLKTFVCYSNAVPVAAFLTESTLQHTLELEHVAQVWRSQPQKRVFA